MKTGENFKMGVNVYRTYREKLSEIAEELKELRDFKRQPKEVEELSKKIADDYREIRELLDEEDTKLYNQKLAEMKEDTQKLGKILDSEIKSGNQIKTEVMMLWKQYQKTIGDYRNACYDKECTSNYMISMQLYILSLFEEFTNIASEISETVKDQKKRILEL